MYLYLYRTRLGTLTRAVMVSRDEALATGIDVNFVSAVAFGISIALAGMAGVFAPFILGSITPNMGVAINITAFAVIVVGTLGNPLGTLAGRDHLRRVADADADLPQFLGQSVAEPAADRRAAGASRGHPRKAGAACLNRKTAASAGSCWTRSIAAAVVIAHGRGARRLFQ